ncbi:MAG: phospho-N-acetylmuramoyl-pentapeptide-transferase, partial [Cyanobacteria bacterium J06649_4]
MDARFSSKSVGLSGVKLSGFLAVCLLASAIWLDEAAGRSLGLRENLTGPFVVGTLLSATAGFVALPILRRLKAAQFIREDGPKAHLKKAGTPTMGGIFFIPAAVLVALLWTGFSQAAVAVSVMTLAYGAIGWLDDWQVMRRRSNKGISPRMKLMLQIGCAIAFCSWTMATQSAELTSVAIPFGLTLPLGFLFWPLAGFVLVAESNATNLTDGVDGLMGGAGAIALFGLGVLVAPTHPDL